MLKHLPMDCVKEAKLSLELPSCGLEQVLWNPAAVGLQLQGYCGPQESAAQSVVLNKQKD